MYTVTLSACTTALTSPKVGRRTATSVPTTQTTKHEIQDIEELHAFGKSNHVCPYYLSRQRANADIFFMPYNYLVDPNVRQTLTDMQWKDAIIICDEAHNLGKRKKYFKCFCFVYPSQEGWLNIIDIFYELYTFDRNICLLCVVL